MNNYSNNITKDYILDFIARYNVGNRVYVGFSGGLDSVVLLDLLVNSLSKANIKIHAVHFNHGISDNASRWENFCLSIADSYKIDFITKKLNLSNYTGSIETKARDARRDYWQANIPRGSSIFLAHHLDDQVETVLFRLFRGAGVKGLSGIADVSKLETVNIFRPLLPFSKDILRKYAIDHDLSWIEDEQNKDLAIDRNFIRHKIVPVINNRWPGAKQNISRAAHLCKEANDQLSEATDLYLNEYFDLDNSRLNLCYLDVKNKHVVINVIRACIQRLGLQTLSKEQMDNIYETVVNAKEDRCPIYRISSLTIRRFKQFLYFFNSNREQKLLNLHERADRFLPQTMCSNEFELIDLHGDKYNIRIQGEFENASLTLKYSDWSKKAKKLFQSHEVPVWERAAYPKIFLGNRLLAIVGLWSRKDVLIEKS